MSPRAQVQLLVDVGLPLLDLGHLQLERLDRTFYFTELNRINHDGIGAVEARGQPVELVIDIGGFHVYNWAGYARMVLGVTGYTDTGGFRTGS